MMLVCNEKEEAQWCDCSVCSMGVLPIWGIRMLLCTQCSMLGVGGEGKNKALVRMGLFWSNWVLWAETPLIRDLLQESGFMVSKQWDFREGICSPEGFHLNLSVILCSPLAYLPLCTSVLNLITSTIWAHWVEQLSSVRGVHIYHIVAMLFFQGHLLMPNVWIVWPNWRVLQRVSLDVQFMMLTRKQNLTTGEECGMVHRIKVFVLE